MVSSPSGIYRRLARTSTGIVRVSSRTLVPIRLAERSDRDLVSDLAEERPDVLAKVGKARHGQGNLGVLVALPVDRDIAVGGDAPETVAPVQSRAVVARHGHVELIRRHVGLTADVEEVRRRGYG